MKLVRDFVVSLDLKELEVYKRVFIPRLFPIGEGRAILWCVAFADTVDYWFIEVSREKVSARQVPAEIVAQFDTMHARHEQVGDWFIRPFRLGDRIGILLADKLVYLFEGIHADPVAIPILNPFEQAPPYRGGKLMPFSPAACGSTRDHRLPVIFKAPDASFDYTGCMSLLDIDVAGRTARWSARTADGHPVAVKYRAETVNIHAPEDRSSFLHDLCWTGTGMLVYSIGAHSRPGRRGLGMTYSVLLGCDSEGKQVRLLHEVDESCFGNVLSNPNQIVLEPLFRNGKRKGRQTLYDSATGVESPILFPHGFTKFKLVDASADQVWALGHALWSPGTPGVSDSGKPVRVLVCRAEGPAG